MYLLISLFGVVVVQLCPDNHQSTMGSTL